MSEFKKVECTCSHGYTCRNMQDPNCCAHSCDYNDLVNAFNALKAERDSLAAACNVLRISMDDILEDMQLLMELSAEDCASWKEKIITLLSKSPVHHLVDHDAEVAKAAFVEGAMKWFCDSSLFSEEIEADAEDHAAQLRAKAGV